jgi:hypothetical protein
LLEIWLALDLKPKERNDLSVYLGSQIRDYVTEPRAIADIELLSIVDPGRSAAVSNVRQAIGERLQIARQDALQSLQTARVDHELVDALSRDGATIETLAALNAVGIGRSELSRIAEVFPTSGREALSGAADTDD